MSAITIDNDLVHYEVLGRGRPVILVHGWLSSWRYWVPTMQQLSMKYRTYALDLWGYGDSSKDPSRLSLDSHVRLLADFMDKLGIAKAALVGHSLGAAVVIRFALQNRDKVARLMTINAPLFERQGTTKPSPADAVAPTIPMRNDVDLGVAEPPDGPATDDGASSEPAPAAGAAESNSPTILRRPGLDMPATTGTGMSRAFSLTEMRAQLSQEPLPMPDDTPAPLPDLKTIPNPLRERLLNVEPRQLLERHLAKDAPDFEKLAAESLKTAPGALAVSASSFDRVDLCRDVRRLVSPTLIIHGERDSLLPPPGEELITYLSYGKDDFRCVVWPEAHHFPMLYDPTSFHRLVMDFLDIADLDDLEFKERWVRKVR